MLRCKYYFGWKLSMVSVHSSGISYSGGEEFKRINTVNPGVFETSVHVREKIANWNIAVQEWIRKCIYQRAPFRSKEGNQLYAFTISAFWHGFYPAYYITYALWYVQLYLQTLIFKYTSTHRQSAVVSFYKKTGTAGKWALAFLVTLMFSHSATYFLVLSSRPNFNFMKAICFFPQIALFALLFVFMFLTKKAKKDKKTHLESQDHKEAAKKE
jgi:lysophospholipid acyltransferase